MRMRLIMFTVYYTAVVFSAACFKVLRGLLCIGSKGPYFHVGRRCMDRFLSGDQNGDVLSRRACRRVAASEERPLWLRPGP